MDVITLGTGTLVPRPDRASSCVGVVEGDRSLVFDLGRNALCRMVENGIDPLGLEDVVFTHLHPDHTCELVSLLFALNHAPHPPRTKTLRLVGPEGCSDLVGRLQMAWTWLTPRYPLEVREIGPGPVTDLPFDVEAVRLEHGNTENLGYRVHSVRSGRTMAFTGDTGPCEALVDLARGVDLLVAECAHPDEEASAYHLHPSALGEAAARAGVRHLVVTHLYPQTPAKAVLEGVCRYFPGRVTLARDGLRITV